MTQATDTDIREIKSAIDTLARSVETIARGTEANTKAIADLTLEMRLGFASVDTKLSDIRGEIKQVETQLEGKIDKLDGKITTLTTNVSNLDGRLWGFGDLIAHHLNYRMGIRLRVGTIGIGSYVRLTSRFHLWSVARRQIVLRSNRRLDSDR
jgi:autotransporter translocation and assembly factor TamB